MAKHKKKFFSVYAVTYWTGDLDVPFVFFLKEKKARKYAAKKNESFGHRQFEEYGVEEYEVHL